MFGPACVSMPPLSQSQSLDWFQSNLVSVGLPKSHQSPLHNNYTHHTNPPALLYPPQLWKSYICTITHHTNPPCIVVPPTALEELLEEITDDLTTPPPSYEKVDLESVMVTPTAPPLYPVLPLAESPLPLGVWSVFLSCVSILWEHFLFVCLYIHV